MIFSSTSFLFFFLPLLLLTYYLTPKQYRNIILLLFSLFFYYMGEKWYVLLLLFSCLVNFILGICLKWKKPKIILTIGLTFNLGMLFYFKYTNFFLNTFTNMLGMNNITLKIVLPLGISFFTFQNISYLIDVYKKIVLPQKNFITYATYITLFPQLIAGPIIRYQDLEHDLKNRQETVLLFCEGVKRFLIGLGKKVLIADTVYQIYTNMLNMNASMISYIIVAFCFTFQLYYDFSGYSDMAIGLGKMFGFTFKENFNYPLTATSITDFWRRWHISLSSFFKDYVYIPLGGNRKGLKRQILNLSIVWLLTGLWHGANWNFLLWGLYFLLFLLIEKLVLKKDWKPNFFSHLYTIILIIISFVIFSIPDFQELIFFFKKCLGIGVPIWNKETLYMLKNASVILFLAILGSTPWLKNKIKHLQKGKLKKVIDSGEVIFYIGLFLLTISSIVAGSYHPFIYFRF